MNTNRMARLLILFFLIVTPLAAQPVADEDGDVAVGTIAVDPSALLELHSTAKGFLPPRMTTAQRNLIANPAEGLIIYNVDSEQLEIFSDAGPGPAIWQEIESDNAADWQLEGNAGTIPGTNFVGTTDTAALHIYVNNGTENSLILNRNGSVQRDDAGDARGEDAVDLQIVRNDATEVASGATASIGGGERNRVSGRGSTIPGGMANSVEHWWSGVGSGQFNRVVGSGRYSVIGGGRSNQIDNNAWAATIGGGMENKSSGYFNAIPGGRGLTLSGRGSFGFLGGNHVGALGATPGPNAMEISASDVAVFGNTDIWLANNDGSASQIRFYEASTATGAFPAGTHYTSLEAGAQSTDISYTLPITAPAIDGEVLASTSSGMMSWVDADANAWKLTGNAGTTPGTNYVGTSDATELHIYVNGGSGANSNGLILNTNGSLQRTDAGGLRGIDAVDLQIERRSGDQVAAGEYSVIGGGARNLVSTSGSHSTISGGFSNRIEGASKSATIGGGSGNRIEGGTFYNTVGGGEGNEIGSRSRSVIAGGARNRIDAEYSAIAGGTRLTLTGDGSFGFLGNILRSEVAMTLSEDKIAAFGNTDLLLVNNDNEASRIRFYEANATAGTVPATVNYTSFEAGAQTANISYVLPTAAPTADGQVMASTMTGTMSWSSGIRDDAASGLVRSGTGYGMKLDDPDTNDDGMLDATSDATAVPFGTLRYDASADKVQAFVNDSDGSGTDGWISLH